MGFSKKARRRGAFTVSWPLSPLPRNKWQHLCIWSGAEVKDRSGCRSPAVSRNSGVTASIFLHHRDQKQWQNKGWRPGTFKIKQEMHQSSGKRGQPWSIKWNAFCFYKKPLQWFTCMNVRRLGSNRPELPVKKHKFLRSNPRFCNIWYGAPVSHFLSSRRRAGCAFRADSVSCWWKRLSGLGSGVVSFVPPRSVRSCPLWGCRVHFNTLCWTWICCYISQKPNFL